MLLVVHDLCWSHRPNGVSKRKISSWVVRDRRCTTKLCISLRQSIEPHVAAVMTKLLPVKGNMHNAQLRDALFRMENPIGAWCLPVTGFAGRRRRGKPSPCPPFRETVSVRWTLEEQLKTAMVPISPRNTNNPQIYTRLGARLSSGGKRVGDGCHQQDEEHPDVPTGQPGWLGGPRSRRGVYGARAALVWLMSPAPPLLAGWAFG